MQKLFEKLDTQSFIAVFLVISMVAVTLILILVKPPESDIVKMLLGGLSTVGFASIINFYFGSSSGSKAKDDALIKNSEPKP